ncbi:hypothetical protein QFZ88_004823 [Mesorhizobium sp. YL-MeA3-2017]|jgi:hypothetical protein|nr:hypothetical protein [Mesorhizobium sp. YL-MeA3-2017]
MDRLWIPQSAKPLRGERVRHSSCDKVTIRRVGFQSRCGSSASMENSMLNFGTSAYLKLLALNPKPRDSVIRKRLAGGSGGYDFHKAMRRIAVGNACGRLSQSQVQAELSRIQRLPERKAATAATEYLPKCLGGIGVRELRNTDQTAQSPLGYFTVRFSPDFEMEHDGKVVHVHIWNTAKPPLNLREAIGTMGLFGREGASHTLGILSLRTGELFVLQDVTSARQLAALLANDIERRIDRIRDELDRPSTEDRREKRTS